MNRLLQQLQNQDFTLMVSLPRNDVELAQAAIRGGAQGLKIHLNVHHHASGTRFGSFDEERENITRILEVAGDAPVGVVPGGDPFATVEEFKALAEMGVDFFDAYPGDAPAWSLTQSHLGVMLAAFETGTMHTMQALQQMGMQMCEASVVNQSKYGTPLDALDLARYRELFEALHTPIIVPSQKKITPADLPALKRTGVRGLLIGAVVTGRDAEGIEAATRAFRDAM